MPASPSPTPPKTIQPILSSNVCFRCLSPNHQVKDCRDPVRCRNCRSSGHRQFSCKSPIANLRAPPIPVPASRRSVHTVPSEPRPRSASPPSSPSPPPSTPAHELVPLEAFRPWFMVPSSSSESPVLELPCACPKPRAIRSAPAARPQDKFVLGGRGKEVLFGPPSPDIPCARFSRSPPPMPSPPRPAPIWREQQRQPT